MTLQHTKIEKLSLPKKSYSRSNTFFTMYVVQWVETGTFGQKLNFFIFYFLGIFGRLGDLGAIDKKYDVAISTAVGGGLDTVLVDTVDTAKKSIEYLKKSGAGRGNFLALDKTLRYEHNVTEPFRSPENAPRLIDLITVDDESYKTAFYQKMQ